MQIAGSDKHQQQTRQCGGTGVDLHGARCGAIEEGFDAEVEVRGWTGDGRAEVLVGGADLDDGGIVAVYLDKRAHTTRGSTGARGL